MKIRREISTAILLLVLKIVETNALCYWNTGSPGTECHMYCINSNSISVSNEIEILYNQQGKEDCHQNGIRLLLRPLAYPNNTIASHWFTAAVKVYELEVHLSNVKSISTDAFNSNAFGTVKKLIFLNLEVELIRNGTFHGLDELEIINIQGAENVNLIEKGVLDTLKELKEFTFEQKSKKDAININGITGSKPLTKLEHVKIKYNLGLIKTSTFIGLTNVKYLDLSDCEINAIEKYSLDPMANSIEELNLSRNKLTTVPDDIFNTILLNIQLIHINSNNWNCNCELLPLRLIIEQYRNNFTDSNCLTPPACSTILGSSCFDDCYDDLPTSSSTATSRPTTTTTTAITTDLPNVNLNIQCYERSKLENSDSVSIKRPIGYMTIKENDHGEDTLNIVYEQDADSSVIIWFSTSNQNSGDVVDQDITCISGSDIDSIPMTNLVENLPYLVCLMDETSTNVSPLDCISHMKRDQNDSKSAWLFQSSKTLTVILIVLSLVTNIAFGIAIGLWMFNYNPFSRQKSRAPKFSIEAIDSVIFKHEVEDRLSKMTTYTNSTMVRTSSVIPLQCDSINSPPLPERPPNMKIVEEPVYASVEEIYRDNR